MREKDCNKTGSAHSEVTKIVPLKPQRSKKSLNKENKDFVNPQTQSQSVRSTCGAAGDVQMTKSCCESRRRLDDNAVLQSAVLCQQQTQLHQQIKNELFAQQELRDCRDTKRAGVLHEDHFQIMSEFSSKFPTAPPRTLPLKTQWSRDRPSNMDSSHIHYRTQETAKRKQAVNHLPPNLFVHHRKVKHCMSFRRCRADLVFAI